MSNLPAPHRRELAVLQEHLLEGPMCPFYGFVGLLHHGVLMENHGNACALTGEHRPCQMEMAKKRPDWDNCTAFNTEDFRPTLEMMMDHLTMHPRVLRQDESESWQGGTLKDWFRHVMRRDTLERPDDAPP